MNNVKRPPLDFPVGASDVLANNAETNQLHSAHEQNCNHGAGPALHETCYVQVFLKNHSDDSEERHAGGQEARPGRQTKRKDGKGHHAVGSEVQHSPHREFGYAGGSCGPMVGDRTLRKAEPTDHSAHVTIPLGHGQECVYHLAIQKTEVTGIQRDSGVGQAIDQPVENLGGPQFESGLTIALRADTVNHFVSFLPFLEEFHDHFRRILQIGIDDDDRVASGVFQTGGNGDLVPEIAGKPDDPDTRVLLLQGAKNGSRRIRASVIHIDQLEKDPGSVEDLPQSLVRSD